MTARAPGGRGRAIARAACLAAASIALHAGAWQAGQRWLVADRPVTPARANPIVVSLVERVAEAEPARARSETAAASPAARVPPVADASRVHRTPTGPTVPSASPTPAAVDDAPHFHETWEVDREPEYLYPPIGLDDLPARVGRIETDVTLYVDARGQLVRIELGGATAAAGVDKALLRDALSEAFAPVSFIPARRAERPVPVRIRYRLALDPAAPIALGFALLN